jgi:catechol 2,3-dioxygenase-like lactoylglutathione lyase family enzyme
MITFKRADHIHICVPPERLEEARQFYADVVGLKPTHRPEVFRHPGYWFEIGDIGFHIGVERGLLNTSRHSAFEVTDLEAARKQLESNGVKTYEEERLSDRERFFFLDPFGNRMELLEYIVK